MKIDIHINGRISIGMVAETDIEAVVLKAMLEAAEKGQAVAIMSTDDKADAISVSVER